MSLSTKKSIFFAPLRVLRGSGCFDFVEEKLDSVEYFIFFYR